jgi:proline iminopeptidase/L-proline amide hydrolase
MFVVGQYDEARIDTVQDFLALTPGAELAVVPGGSHAYITERPAVAEAILRDWMSRIDARERAGK